MLGALAAVVVVASCSTGDERSGKEAAGATLGAVAKATAEARAARVVGTRSHGPASGPLEGAFAADPPAGRLVLPVFLPDGDRHRIEVRLVGDSVFVDRVAVPPATVNAGLTLTDRLAVRIETDPRWLRRPSRAFTLGGNVALLGPFQLLDQLVAGRGELDAALRDGDLTRYTVGPEDALARFGIAGARLWVDDQGRLRRFRLDTTSGVFDAELHDFGIAVDVQQPPDGVVTAIGTASESMQPSGEFSELASGMHAGVAWRLESAPAREGGMCWRFSSKPRLVPNDGRTSCTPKPTATLPPEFAIEFPFTSDGSASAEVVVATSFATIEDATFFFADDTRAAPVAARFTAGAGAIVWVGSSEPPVGGARLVTADGVKIFCAPGAITGPNEIAGMDPDELAEHKTFAWACSS